MRIEQGRKLDFKDVLIRPKRSTLASRNDVSLVRRFVTLHSKKQWEGVPIMASNMDTVSTMAMAEALTKERMITCIQVGKTYTVEEFVAFIKAHPEVAPYVAASFGMSDANKENMKAVFDQVPEIELLCLDVANGYTQVFVDYVKEVRASFPDKIIVAGNVCTPEQVEELVLCGADIIKVGIGPGSVCTTRKMTGVGYPQLSAVIECADAAHGLGAHIISDGGCKVPGDMAKAFGAGADFVMIGGMLAGHDESGGEVIEENGRKYCMFYGMSSSTAMKKYHGGQSTYRASEGKTVKLPYRGPVASTLQEMLGGIRSTLTYVGARELRELSKRTTFVLVTQQLNEVYSRYET